MGTECCCCVLQVVLLDPVSYPGAIKAFAKEVCRNDLSNFGRLHFFFPDSRLSLDLNTDKTLKARPCPVMQVTFYGDDSTAV